MIVVSDSSPLIALSAVGQLGLLQRLFTMVLVPEAVFGEVTERGAGRAGADELATAEWIQRCSLRDATLRALLTRELDEGEAAAVALAVERGADLVLLDERHARTVAHELGLAVTGVLGVLVAAKQRGMLPEVRPMLQALRAEAGFWVGDELYARVLAMVGEGE